VGKPLKKTHTWSGGTGVRTRDLPNVKWRARRLATVLGATARAALRIYSLRDRRIGRDDWWEPVFRWGSGEHSTYQKGGGVSFASVGHKCSVSSDLAFVSDGRDSSSVLSDRQGDCLVFVVLCSVPVPRPVFSTRSARFAYICAVLRSSPAIRPHNSLQRGPHWRKCRSSAFSSIHLKDPVLLHHKL
jgi:hypothetical protein